MIRGHWAWALLWAACGTAASAAETGNAASAAGMGNAASAAGMGNAASAAGTGNAAKFADATSGSAGEPVVTVRRVVPTLYLSDAPAPLGNVPAQPIRPTQAEPDAPAPLGPPPTYGPPLGEVPEPFGPSMFERGPRRAPPGAEDLIHARAAAEAIERHRRLSTRQYLGISLARPTWNPMPYYGEQSQYRHGFAYRSGTAVVQPAPVAAPVPSPCESLDDARRSLGDRK